VSDLPDERAPLVDVILCTYRLGDYLQRSLESLKRQSWPQWRLTLVNDGSNDPGKLEQIIEGIPNAQVIHQARAGLPAARNNGIKNSAGDLVTFMDDDDIWREDRIERLVDALCKDRMAVGAFSGGWYMNADGEPFGTGWTAENATSLEMLRGRVPFPRIVTLLVTRDVLTEIGGFDESFSLAEDDEFILRLLGAGELVAAPEQLVGYRRHASNMTNAHISARRAASERLLTMHIERAGKEGREDLEQMIRENRTAYRCRAAADCVGSSSLAFRSGDFATGVKEIAWALNRAPLSFLRSAASRTRTRLVS